MRVLVAYMSSTGNTKKVAEAIYSGIDCEKEIRPMKEVADISGWDLAFLGFPVHGYGPDKKARQVISELCKDGKKVALFITHAAPEGEADVQAWLDKFRQAASGADIIGMFNCQGQLAGGIKTFMKIFGNKDMKSQAKMDNSQGQPDQSRLDKAKAFATDTMRKVRPA